MTFIKIPTGKGMMIVATATIIRIEALNNYSKLYFTDRRPLVVAKVLHWFEIRLPETVFYRIHKSHLVNSSFIEKVNISSRHAAVMLQNGETISISRRRRSLLPVNNLTEQEKAA